MEFGHTRAAQPNNLLVRFRDKLAPGKFALDLACGSGRNSVYLAQCGQRVFAIDRSAEALDNGRELARLAGVRVNWIRADLASSELPVRNLHVVTCFYYRDPHLYPLIRTAVARGGFLFYETFTLEQLNFPSGPRNRDYLLKPGELLEVFRDWRVLYYREVASERGLASLIAQKP